MGAWDFKALDSDKAEEWLIGLWIKYPFQSEVERTLQKNAEDYPEEIRAAAFVLHEMKDLLVWDGEDYSRLALLAIQKLEKVSKMEIFQDDDFLSAISAEIEQLRSSH